MAIVRAVLALGQSLDIPVLAEGIETDDQKSILLAEGCNEGQGYLLGRPAPLTDLALQREPARAPEAVASRGRTEGAEPAASPTPLAASA